jgi:hypothetical protein
MGRSNTIVPVAQLGQGHIQEHGRIRLGVKTQKAMKSIDTFRFTSADEAAIQEIAVLYGGKPQAWNEPKANPPNQFEVITTSKELRVFLPPACLSCWYEQWTGGGCVRRCDGTTVEVPHGDDMTTVPCLCTEQNKRVCEPHTRLQVILPEIRFGGVWRLETKGWHAAKEMPSMENMITALQAYGVIEGVLSLERAQSQGGRRKFVVPRLRLASSAVALLAGENVAALHAGHQGVRELTPAIDTTEYKARLEGEEPASTDSDWFDQDDDIVDAEIVEERSNPSSADGATPDGAAGSEVPPAPDPAPSDKPMSLTAQEKKLVICCNEAAAVAGIDPTLFRHGLCRKATKGRSLSSRHLDSEEKSTVIDWADKVRDGSWVATLATEAPPKIVLAQP